MRYETGDFRTRAEEILQQNEARYTYWREVGQIEPPQMGGAAEAIKDMESAARLLDVVFVEKQGNLTEPVAGAGGRGSNHGLERRPKKDCVPERRSECTV